MRPLLLTALVAALLAALSLAPAAGAAGSLRIGLQDDAYLAWGPGTLEDRVAKLDALGVRLVRFNLVWNEIAQRKPRVQRNHLDPRYNWNANNAEVVLTALRDAGIDAVVGIHGSPRWTNGGRAPSWAPKSGSALANFAFAAQKRFPWVRQWLIWNEPNQRRWLRPTSARVYVQKLLNPAYRSIKAANRRARIAGGVTAPRAGAGGVSPVRFIREMGAAGAKLDAYAHHPYALQRGETPSSGACVRCATLTMATLDRLISLVRTSFRGPTRIWLTEWGYQTDPPDRFTGVSYRKQADYILEAARIAKRAPLVDMLIQFLYRDEVDASRWNSGLERANGRTKPAKSAFRRAVARYSR